MAFASFLGGFAIVLWLGLAGYLVWGVARSVQQPLGKKRTISLHRPLLGPYCSL